MTLNDTAPRADSPDPNTDTGPAPDADETPTSETDADPDTTDDDADDNPSREAAKWRTKFRAAQQEIATLEGQIGTMRRAQIADAVEAAGYKAKLAELIDADTVLTDAGAVDSAKLAEAITATAAAYGMAPTSRPPKPNRQQGAGAGQPHGSSSWSQALQGR
jgi:soluble cytochrome b562